MGRVYRARHHGLDRVVAVKVLSRSVDELDSTALVRFQREARAAARLDSRHVVRVLDAGATESGAPYLVMEHLEGESVSSRLTRMGHLSLAETACIIDQAAVALGAAHSAGIVHRDVSSGNLFLTSGGDGAPCLKVLDFGVAKLLGDDASTTRTGAAIGTPRYMSPEQTLGLAVDARADVWGLAVVAYEALCGAPPFRGGTAGAVAIELSRGAFEAPSIALARRPHDDEAPASANLDAASLGQLDALMTRAFARDIAERPQTAAEFASALRGILDSAPSVAAPSFTWGATRNTSPTEPSDPTSGIETLDHRPPEGTGTSSPASISDAPALVSERLPVDLSSNPASTPRSARRQRLVWALVAVAVAVFGLTRGSSPDVVDAGGPTPASPLGGDGALEATTDGGVGSPPSAQHQVKVAASSEGAPSKDATEAVESSPTDEARSASLKSGVRGKRALPPLDPESVAAPGEVTASAAAVAVPPAPVASAASVPPAQDAEAAPKKRHEERARPVVKNGAGVVIDGVPDYGF
jgi:serine/threonine-protein kinase